MRRFGLDNVIPMVPFCRTLDEGRKLYRLLKITALKERFM